MGECTELHCTALHGASCSCCRTALQLLLLPHCTALQLLPHCTAAAAALRPAARRYVQSILDKRSHKTGEKARRTDRHSEKFFVKNVKKKRMKKI